MELALSIAKLLSSIAIIIAASVAVYGINAWRREIKWKKRYELAEEVLTAFYEARSRIESIRSPFGYVGEGSTRKRADDETEEQSKIRDQAFVVIERYQQHSEFFNKLFSLKFRFMALFEEDSGKPFNDLIKTINEIMNTSRSIGVFLEYKKTENMTDNDVEEYWKMQAVVSSNIKEDKIAQKIEQIIVEVENICRPIIKGNDKKSGKVNYKLPVIISIFALVFSALSLYWTYSHDIKNDKINYMQNAMFNSPMLRITNPLQTLYCEYSIDTVFATSDDSAITVAFNAKIKGKVTFVNKGPSTAHILLISIADTITYNSILREIVLTSEGRKKIEGLLQFEYSSPFPGLAIHPFDTSSIEIEKRIRYFSKDSIQVIHVFVLYQNDADALYDVYYKLLLKTHEILTPMDAEFFDDGILMKSKFASRDLVSFEEDNEIPRIYSYDEKNDIIKWLNKLEKGN